MLINDGGGGGTADIGASMMAFKGAALAGGFAVNDTGGDALLTAIRAMKDWVDENRAVLFELRQEPMLGSSHGANTMKQFVPQVAGDSQGFLTMLMKFRESLDSAEEGIHTAMNNYRANDQGSAKKFTSA